MKLITNNPLLKEEAIGGNIELVFIDGWPDEVLSYGRDLVHQGYPLACDPGAGRFSSRKSPYITLFIKEKKVPSSFEQISALESLIRQEAQAHWDCRAEMQFDYQSLNQAYSQVCLEKLGEKRRDFRE